MKSKYKLSIVVPVYNEEKNIEPLVARLKAVVRDLSCKYEIIFVLDPCNDSTEQNILNLHKKDSSVKLLRMSRRFGQPACIMAGIHYASGDACVIIDADLQDPPELIKDMITEWQRGYDVVYAKRVSRKGETIIKRIVAFIGYWFINRISEQKIPRDTGDFRLMSKQVVKQLKNLKEHDSFLRGLVAYVGFNQIGIPYQRDERYKEKGKYNRYFGSLRIGFNGVFGFSKTPLHAISVIGLIIAFCSLLLGLTYLILKLVNVEIPWGNPTLVMLISFLGGIQILSLGIIGEYLARMFDEIKGRPSFIIDKAIGFNGADIDKVNERDSQENNS